MTQMMYLQYFHLGFDTIAHSLYLQINPDQIAPNHLDLQQNPMALLHQLTH